MDMKEKAHRQLPFRTVVVALGTGLVCEPKHEPISASRNKNRHRDATGCYVTSRVTAARVGLRSH